MLYASCSLLLYFLRNYNSRLLLILGFLIYFIPSFSNVYFISNVKNQYSERELSKISQKWYPDNESIQKELDLFRGNQIKASKCLGFNRNTLRSKINLYGIEVVKKRKA